MHSESFIKKANNLRSETNKFRNQLIVIVGGVLAVFVAIHGDSVVSFNIKYGFSALGISLICGVLSIVFDLLQSTIELIFEYKDKILPRSVKRVSEMEKEYMEDMNEEVREDFNKIKKILHEKTIEYEKLEKGKIRSKGLEIMNEITERQYISSFASFLVGAQVSLFIAGVVSIIVSIIS